MCVYKYARVHMCMFACIHICRCKCKYVRIYVYYINTQTPIRAAYFRKFVKQLTLSPKA